MRKTKRKIYLDVGFAVVAIAFLAVFFNVQLQKASREQVLNALTEISDQSKKVIEGEVDKNRKVLTNLAIYIGNDESLDVLALLERLKHVDSGNKFKRMGIVLPDKRAFATDHEEARELNDEDYSRFAAAMNGEVTVSDVVPDILDGEPLTVYCVPVVFKDGSRCVLFGAFSTEYYEEVMTVPSFDNRGYSYMVKRSGSYIAGSVSKDRTEFENLFDAMYQVSNRFDSKQIAEIKQDIQDGNHGVIQLHENKENKYLYYQPLNVNDWYLISVVPVSVVQKNINGLLLLAYALLASCTLVVVYLVLRIYFMKRKSTKYLEEIALVDRVTGKKSFEKFKIDAQLILNSEISHLYAVAYFNINNFQYINDLYGYEEGNRALCKIAKCFEERIVAAECVARMRADHFVGLIRYENEENLVKRIQDIIERIQAAADMRESETPYQVKMVAGIYRVTNRDELLDTMIDRAGMVLRESGQAGFHICGFYDDAMRSQMLRERELEDRFENALNKDEFTVYYQPKFDLRQKCFYGAEALVRWNSSDLGWISPGEFVPVLERNGMIVELDEYVFRHTCCQIRAWLDAGYPAVPVSVNVSQLHLYRMDFAERYLNIIKSYQIPENLVELELTETALFENAHILAAVLGVFRERNIRILMDDFGSGYSSVNMLKNIPVDVLKIDKSMLDDVKENDTSSKILEGIISLVQALQMEVVVEGVETEEQWEMVKRMNVDYVQGFYCARPMPASEYEEILKSGNKKLEKGQKS